MKQTNKIRSWFFEKVNEIKKADQERRVTHIADIWKEITPINPTDIEGILTIL